MPRVIQTDRAPAAIGPYSQAVHASPFLFTAGQIGLDPSTTQLVPGGVEAETRQALSNLGAIVEAAGGQLQDIVKTTIFLVDMQDFKTVNTIYAEFFSDRPPARSTVAVAALPAGARFEVEAVAKIS